MVQFSHTETGVLFVQKKDVLINRHGIVSHTKQ